MGRASGRRGSGPGRHARRLGVLGRGRLRRRFSFDASTVMATTRSSRALATRGRRSRIPPPHAPPRGDGPRRGPGGQRVRDRRRGAGLARWRRCRGGAARGRRRRARTRTRSRCGGPGRVGGSASPCAATRRARARCASRSRAGSPGASGSADDGSGACARLAAAGARSFTVRLNCVTAGRCGCRACAGCPSGCRRS